MLMDWQLLFLLWSVRSKMLTVMILKNFETGEVKDRMNMTHREKDERNALLNFTPYMWEEVNE